MSARLPAPAPPPSFGAPAWQVGARRVQPAGRPLVMGILNLTPDSFYAASRQPDADAAVEAGLAALAAGADLLDLGAASSRPGAEPVPPPEEQARLLPALRALRRRTAAPLTVDTWSADTARRALDEGADGVNDITAGRGDPGLLPLVAARGAGLLLMHMQGEPRTMQQRPSYADVVREVAAFLAERAAAARAAGVAPDRIAIDPGIGFGKRLEHNLALLARLDVLARAPGAPPVALGASRKSFIGALTGAPAEERLPGSLAALAAAFSAGVAIVRVHDVAATRQFLDVLAAIAAAPGATPGAAPSAG